MSTNSRSQGKYIPIKEGLLAPPLEQPDKARLIGSKCQNCKEVFLGRQSYCLNCSSEKLKEIKLSNKGILWSYTIVRHRPPGDYMGPVDPFVPLVLGLIELPDGIRILSPVECHIDNIHIGMALDLHVYELYQDGDGNSVMAFKFRALQE